MTVIYIIHKPGTSFYKVGVTNNIDQRYIQLNTHPEPILLLSQYEFGNRDYALYVENVIQKMLDNICFKRHLKNEWYSMSKADLIVIDDVLVQIFGGHVSYNTDKKEFKMDIDDMLVTDVSIPYKINDEYLYNLQKTSGTVVKKYIDGYAKFVENFNKKR